MGTMGALVRLDCRTVRIRDGFFRWILVQRFGQSGPRLVDARQLLALLLAHPAYRDDYASAETEAAVHGPYRLDALSPDCFDEVSASDAIVTLTSWLEQFGPVNPRDIDGDLDGVYRVLREASALFSLRDLGNDAHHARGWVLGKTGFHEFVLVEPGGEVVLIVASDD